MENETEPSQAVREFSARIWSLINRFESLREYQRPEPDALFSLDAFDGWVAESIDSDAGRHAAAFVRSIFAGVDHEFDFVGAFKTWKGNDRSAFFSWCHSPFWPPK